MAKEWILNSAMNRFQLNFKRNKGITWGLLVTLWQTEFAMPRLWLGQITRAGYLAPHPAGAPTQILASLGLQIAAGRYAKFWHLKDERNRTLADFLWEGKLFLSANADDPFVVQPPKSSDGYWGLTDSSSWRICLRETRKTLRLLLCCRRFSLWLQTAQQRTVDQTILLLWQAFSQRLNNINLNAKNNPLYPSTNPDNIEGLADSPSLLEVVLQNNLQQVSLTDHLNSQIQENNNVQPAFQLISAVRGIGGKIASFFLRDLVIIYQLDLSPVNGRYLLQPIDVWVQRTISQLANIPANQKQRIAEWIVETSIQHNVNPELVNMGVWFFCSTIVVSAYRLQSILSDLQLAQQLAHHYSLKVASTNERCQNFA